MRLTLLLLFLISTVAIAQQPEDSVRILNEVIVKSYGAQKPLYRVPAAIGLLGAADMNRFSNVAIVSAVNTLAGVRMEERSPGSYRLSIRGSSLRSPFGVRNVKIYWNQLPLTDPGGNTYLNQLDAGSIHQMEIIKGPGSSLYGGGTGGVVLLESLYPRQERGVSLQVLSGSYGLSTAQISLRDGDANSSHHIQYLHQQSDGYRAQTRLVRDAVNSTFRFDLSDHQVLEAVLLFTDLYYQTPGGLTQAEMENNPRQARPRAGTNPGAEEQNAGVSLRSFYTGVSHEYRFTDKLHNRTGVYGNFVQFQNPAIRNYERRLEQNFGARSVTDFSFEIGDVNAVILGGGELQHGYSPIKTYQNLQGFSGLLQSDDEVRTFAYSVFGQGELTYKSWLLTGGLSVNGLDYKLLQLTNTPAITQTKNYSPVITPRVAISKKITDHFSAYTNVSFGYSAPTLAEVRPSTGIFNYDLKSERGRQIEIGTKGYLLNKTIHVEVSLYNLSLDEAIVVRRAPDGADFFVNAGGTTQNGVEFTGSWTPRLPEKSFFKNIKFWTSGTFTDYTFKNYVKNDISYSGNRLTGTPKNIASFGFDIEDKRGGYLRTTFNHTGTIPLDDANTVYSKSYSLLGVRIGSSQIELGKLLMEVFVGADNLLDEKYSLGNDLNAAAGRYFNPAPGRTYYSGVKLNLNKIKE